MEAVEIRFTFCELVTDGDSRKHIRTAGSGDGRELPSEERIFARIASMELFTLSTFADAEEILLREGCSQ